MNTFDYDRIPINRGIIGTDELEVVDTSAKLDIKLPLAVLSVTGGYSKVEENVMGTASWTKPPTLGEAPVIRPRKH